MRGDELRGFVLLAYRQNRCTADPVMIVCEFAVAILPPCPNAMIALSIWLKGTGTSRNGDARENDANGDEGPRVGVQQDRRRSQGFAGLRREHKYNACFHTFPII